MEGNDREEERGKARSAGGRWPAAFHVSLSVLLAILLTTALNLLAARVNFTREHPLAPTRAVSDRTREILSHVQGSMRITCFFDPGHPLFRPAGRLLRGFEAVAKQAGAASLQIRYVDPRRDLAQATAMKDLDVPPNALLFEGQGRRIVVSASDLVVTNQGTRPMFRGETVCAAAVARLSRATQPAIYWLQGHGEGDLADYDPRTGFSAIAREIRHEGYDLRPLLLWETKGVPADAEGVIIAGPRQGLAGEEGTWIEAYLTRGGRILALVNPAAPPSGLESALERWGVRVTPWTAVTRATLSGHDTVILQYGNHPITRSLTRSATVFFGSRCLLPAAASDAGGADRAKYTALALTDRDGWGARAADAMPRLFDPREDLPGPVALAVAVERGGEAGKDIALQPTRLVVFGESAFVANATLAARSSANRDLFINALNWLTGIESGTCVSGGGDAALWTGLGPSGWMRFTLLASVAMPVAVLAAGFLIVERRRRK